MVAVWAPDTSNSYSMQCFHRNAVGTCHCVFSFWMCEEKHVTAPPLLFLWMRIKHVLTHDDVSRKPLPHRCGRSLMTRERAASSCLQMSLTQPSPPQGEREGRHPSPPPPPPASLLPPLLTSLRMSNPSREEGRELQTEWVREDTSIIISERAEAEDEDSNPSCRSLTAERRPPGDG